MGLDAKTFALSNDGPEHGWRSFVVYYHGIFIDFYQSLSKSLQQLKQRMSAYWGVCGVVQPGG